ncbi:hypothetical protein AB0N23_17380, partial [Streptomyces sp. NPDC052644]
MSDDTPRARAPHGCAAVFLPAALPRDGRVAFWSPDGSPLPAAPPPAQAAPPERRGEPAPAPGPGVPVPPWEAG